MKNKASVPEDIDNVLIKQAQKEFRKFLKNFVEKFSEIKPHLPHIYEKNLQFFYDSCFELDKLDDLHLML